MTAQNDVAALVERAQANVRRVDEESADMYDAWIAERGGTTSRAHWKARAVEAEAKVAALQAEVERAKEEAPPDSVTEREIRDRAWKVIKDCGWKNGNRVGLHSVVELMVRLGMDLARDPVEDRCNYPDCGCDFDAVCEMGLQALASRKENTP